MRIKICGVTSVADALAAVECGADALGLNFFPGSPRCVSRHVAEEIVAELPPFVQPVAVVVKPSAAAVRDCRDLLRNPTVQCHGLDFSESELPAALMNCQLILAWGVADSADVAETPHFLATAHDLGLRPAAILIDARVPGQFGGTGRQPPWHLLQGQDYGLPLILAGGLTPENVAEAIRLVRPYAVDVASSVESQPGKKDREKMRRFIAEARNAASALGL